MNKLRTYFSKRREDSSLELEFPELDVNEENEIMEMLGLPSNTPFGTLKDTVEGEETVVNEIGKVAGRTTKELLMSTLRTFAQYDEEDMLAGTVRIKTNTGEEAVGTVRIKQGEDNGRVSYFGTIKINCDGEESIVTDEEQPNWADFGSVKITLEDINSGTTKICTNEGVSFVYRPPEEWELNILALEKGEWANEMNSDAFGKFRKKRAGVQDLFWKSAGKERASKEKEIERITPVRRSKSEKNVLELRSWVASKNKESVGQFSSGSKYETK